MPRGIRKLIFGSTGKKAHVGTGKAIDSESNLSLPADNLALGLEVLVEGENPIVEYVLQAIQRRTTARLKTADFRVLSCNRS
jgi:hypothetical protein